MSNDELKKQIADAIASGKIQPTTIVFGDNVQHKIEKVEAGGIGVQVNYSVPKPQRPAAEPTKKTKQEDTFEPDYMTFTKKHADNYNLVLLYQDLLAAKWIADGNPDHFGALFSGQQSMDKITWIGKGVDNLYALFRMMVDEQFIEAPKGHGVERIVRSHFVTKDGDFVAGDSCKPSQKAKSLIDSWKRDLSAKPKSSDD